MKNSNSRYRLDDSIPYLIYRISNKANQNVHDKLRPAGITLSKWRLLSSLKSRGVCTVSELAACTVMRHAVVSRILTEMEDAGLIKREQSITDQRMVQIKLTKMGTVLFQEAHEIAEKHQDEALKGFSRTDIATLVRFLHRIQKNVGINL